MAIRHACAAVVVFLCTLATSMHIRCEEPQKVSVCELKDNRVAYNHKLISIEGFVSHDFEDFTVFDPACRNLSIWLEYGGKRRSDTMYCCGVAPGKKRPKQLVVEDIPITLVDNDKFRQFDREIQPPFRSGNFGSVVHATLIGRFFSGQPQKFAGGAIMWGYGHMGCCSLLAIQEVTSVDPQDRDDLDYGASGDMPDIDNNGCGGYQFMTPIFPGSEAIAMQRAAESDPASKAFDDPEAVAREFFTKNKELADLRALKLTVKRKAEGRIVYDGFDSATGTKYLIVISRPYFLSFYARDPHRIAWVPTDVSLLTNCD